jgi:hypothetical protein
MGLTATLSLDRQTRASVVTGVWATVKSSSLVGTPTLACCSILDTPWSMRLVNDPPLRRAAASLAISNVSRTVIWTIIVTTFSLFTFARLPANATSGPTLGAIVGKQAPARFYGYLSEQVGCSGLASALLPSFSIQ